MSDVQIEPLEGSESFELTPRERMLMDSAFSDGYAAGERHGIKVGGEEALHAATTLTTLMSNPLWARSIDTLRWFEGKVD